MSDKGESLKRKMSDKGESLKRKRKRRIASRKRDGSWTRCMYWMEKKRRYCCMPRVDGIMFCGTHSPLQKRVPCPLDPNHTVRESELEAHLKKCTTIRKMRELRAKPYYLCDCNIGGKLEDDEKIDEIERWENLEDFEKWLSTQLCTLRTYFSKQKESAIRTYAKYLHIPNESGKYIASVKAFKSNASLSSSVPVSSSHEPGHMYMKFSSERHRKQHEGIISLLRKHDSVINRFKKTTIIEFGSGRAGLSWALNCALNEEAKKRNETRRERFLLIDRDSISKKHEKYFTGAESSTRICMDIRHLNLRGVSELSRSSSSNLDGVSSISKHLCGAATDLSLRCLHNFDREREHRTQVIAYALCCHGACKWQEFVGRTYFRKILKFDRHDFSKVAKSSGWMCGYGSMSLYPDIDMKTRLRYIALGRACKRLVDAGRILFLVRDMNMQHAELVPYCDETLTPENLMLLAWSNK